MEVPFLSVLMAIKKWQDIHRGILSQVMEHVIAVLPIEYHKKLNRFIPIFPANYILPYFPSSLN
jgi:hypothetical protein